MVAERVGLTASSEARPRWSPRLPRRMRSLREELIEARDNEAVDQDSTVQDRQESVETPKRPDGPTTQRRVWSPSKTPNQSPKNVQETQEEQGSDREEASEAEIDTVSELEGGGACALPPTPDTASK